MKRGDLVTIAIQGDFGKPRPALILQSDVFNDIHETVTIALLSSALIQAPIFRLNVTPNEKNGLTKECQIQIDKIMTVRKTRIGAIFGQLDEAVLVRTNRAFALWLGLA